MSKIYTREEFEEKFSDFNIVIYTYDKKSMINFLHTAEYFGYLMDQENQKPTILCKEYIETIEDYLETGTHRYYNGIDGFPTLYWILIPLTKTVIKSSAAYWNKISNPEQSHANTHINKHLIGSKEPDLIRWKHINLNIHKNIKLLTLEDEYMEDLI